MPRFVILHHEMPADHERESHWDFMLEDGDHLLTWAFDKSPLDCESGTAMQLPNHRLAYLSKEGPVSGGRGSVKRLDTGTFEWVDRDEGKLTVELAGKHLAGKLFLSRQDEEAWVWERDPSDR